MTAASNRGLVRPFTGYVATSQHSRRILGPPSAHLTRAKKEQTRSDPLNFRHALSRRANNPLEVARQWVDDQVGRGALQAVESALFVYRQKYQGISSLGLLAEVSLEAAANGRIKPHERTFPKTTDKMVAYMSHTRVYGNPIALGGRGSGPVAKLVESTASQEPNASLTSADDAVHDLWFIEGDAAWDICKRLDDTLFVTDGHHRLAASSDLAAQENRTDYIPAGIFQADQLDLATFARIVTDPDIRPADLLTRIAGRHHISEVAPEGVAPTEIHHVGAHIGGVFYQIELDTDSKMPESTLVQQLLLEPFLGIQDPTSDPRLSFSPSTGQLPRGEEFVWFLPHPESVEKVFRMADSGKMMPPKSTLFEPKLPAGLLIRYIDRS